MTKSKQALWVTGAVLLAILLGLVMRGMWTPSTAEAQIVMDPQPSGVAYTLPITVFDSNSPWRAYETMPDACDVYVYQDFTSGARATNSITDLGRFGSLVLTAGEMTGSKVIIVDVNDDTDPPLFGDSLIYIPLIDSKIDLIWDELLTGGAHRIKGSGADYLRKAATGGTSGGGDEDIPIASGTAQAGTTNTITLAAATVDGGTDNKFATMPITITGGTAVGDSRVIASYNGTTNLATVYPNFSTPPDGTSTYEITGAVGSVYSDSGTAQAGGASSITLAATADDANDVYKGAFVYLLSGTGSGQAARLIDDYDGPTKVADVNVAWGTEPDSTSIYAVVPGGEKAGDSVVSTTVTNTYTTITTGVSIDANEILDAIKRGSWSGRRN
jgi:hypothetical protein